eukprot:CAMPEP_0172498306 /NCGR_PEP_ID=MMETSP1066-20121228/112016_1 /TAXON_ID=671091 /ORGANISM="Coscinodiscus wailesii, Strain CCMP2513" /LENGTH=267 /DNA_ID=CAMNT_0013271531 /DNA_START=40 /DNA_END=843 /DNA_ORIENTATION=+
MKFTTLPLLFIVGCVGAVSRPQISIQVRDGALSGDIEAIDPTITWEGSSSYFDFDLEYGTEASLQVTDDFASLPRNVWGRVSRRIGQWGVSAHAKVFGNDMKNAKVELAAGSENDKFSSKLMGSLGNSGASVDSIQVTKGFDFNTTHYVALTPRFNVADKTADMFVSYSKDKTNVGLSTSRTSQKISVSQQIGENNRIMPTFSSGGEFSLGWERFLGKGSSITTVLTPDKDIDVVWKDGEWKANINMPLDGISISGANVNIKRELKL